MLCGNGFEKNGSCSSEVGEVLAAAVVRNWRGERQLFEGSSLICESIAKTSLLFPFSGSHGPKISYVRAESLFTREFEGVHIQAPGWPIKRRLARRAELSIPASRSLLPAENKQRQNLHTCWLEWMRPRVISPVSAVSDESRSLVSTRE
jgi:hypothetical protein